MKAERCLALIVLVSLAAAQQLWAVPVTVEYEAASLGGAQWSYTYTVINDSLPAPIREITVWFDHSLCRNLQVVTPVPPGADWDELVIQPDFVLQDDGFYDALSLSGGIATGWQVAGFAVEFEWLGADQPGLQVFQIVDPTTFETIYEGFTVPEPGTTILLGLAIAIACRRHRVVTLS
jgi:hypothetical protein